MDEITAIAAREEKRTLLRHLDSAHGLTIPVRMRQTLRALVKHSLDGKGFFRTPDLASWTKTSQTLARDRAWRLYRSGWLRALTPPRPGRPETDIRAGRWLFRLNRKRILSLGAKSK